jgi:GH24 family phage-related lysozyme (muramidase)
VKTSRSGIDLIKKWEGCRLKAYQDSVGVWTIGYGLTSAAGIVPVTKGMVITQQQADDYLVRSLVKYEAAVTRALTRAPSQPQFDAMVSLCYNIGPGAFAGSTLVRRFNSGDIPGAADAFLMWNKAGGKVLQGLVNRRMDERAFFLRSATAPQKPPEAAPPPPATPAAPEPAQPVQPQPEPPGASLAAWVLGAAAALIAALATWMMKG